MARMILAAALALLWLPAAAQQQRPAEKGRPERPAAGGAQERVKKTPAEIKALREEAGPMLQFAREQSSRMSALKRRHAADRKQLRSGTPEGAPVSEKTRKAMADLARRQRDEWRKAAAERNKENERFLKKNPGSEKALKELMKHGIPVEEPAAGPGVEPAAEPAGVPPGGAAE